MTDVGMTGDYDFQRIGMEQVACVAGALARDTAGQPRLEPAGGATLCAVYLETDDRTGLARQIAPLRVGGRLSEAWPEIM